jgi:8-oxo-dGTP pyrophosphatase MutT (NUDIX family)
MDEIKAALLGSARAAILHETVAILALDPVGRLLMFLRQKPPIGWTLPAGHWERNESSLDAAIRELQEEIGLRVSPERMHQVGELMPSHDQPVTCRRSSLTTHRYHVFSVSLTREECSRIALSDEADPRNRWLWIPIDHILLHEMPEPPEKLTPGTRFVLNNSRIRAELRSIASAGLCAQGS